MQHWIEFFITSAANQKEVLLQITELPVMNGSDSETHLSTDTKRRAYGNTKWWNNVGNKLPKEV